MKLLIFDFDGLIIETETLYYTVWQELLAEYGCPLEFGTWAHSIGAEAGTFDAHQYLVGTTGAEVDKDTLRAQHDTRFYPRLEQQGLRPGVMDYIKEAQRRDLILAIGSSAPSRWVEGNLVRFQLREAFAYFVCREHADRAKPAPDIFNAVLEQTDVSAEDAIVFEDSVNGVRAGKAAGIYTVAVPNSMTQSLNLSEADRIIGSMAEVSLSSILASARKQYA
jgi:HAD superfamily hydrolase (TIGR01509 family)